MSKRTRPSPPSSSGQLFDEMLVVMAQRGDRRAADKLYSRWNARIVRAARRFCGDEDAALDLAHDCWIGVWKGLARLRDPARFRSYVFAVLHRRGADHLRAKMHEREKLRHEEHKPQSPPGSPPSERLAIAQAFDTLPADQRLAAHLHFVEGLTAREIAIIQSIPEGTAKTRLFHARRKLKAALNPDRSIGDNND